MQRLWFFIYEWVIVPALRFWSGLCAFTMPFLSYI